MIMAVFHKHTNDDVILLEKQAFVDDALSMSAKGVLATIIARDGRVNDNFYMLYNKELTKLKDKGYADVVYDKQETVCNISSKKLRKKKKNGEGNYQKIVSDYLGITWNTKVLCVHHINHDHSDNRLVNLLLLPQKMHSKYHMLYQHCESRCAKLLEKDISYNDESIVELTKALAEIKKDMMMLSVNIDAGVRMKGNEDRFDMRAYLNEVFGEMIKKYQ